MVRELELWVPRVSAELIGALTLRKGCAYWVEGISRRPVKTEAQFARKRVVRNVFYDKLKLNVSVCRAFGFHQPYFLSLI